MLGSSGERIRSMTGNMRRRPSTSRIALRNAGAPTESVGLRTRTSSVAFCVKFACLRIDCALAVSPEPVSASARLTVPSEVPRR